MKRLVLLFFVILLISCQEKVKKYTIVLYDKNGFEDSKKEIEATNDSIAYAQGLFAYYGAKVTVKKYNLADKYSFVQIYDENGKSLDVILSTETIDNIKSHIARLPDVKEIQDEDSRLPKL